MTAPFLLLAAVFGFLGVAMGAFGAHGLKHILSPQLFEVYKTAVDYQMWHALALGLTALLPPQRLMRWAACLFTAGIILFSGSLYLLAILDMSWLGIITPFGGLAFLAGWALLAWAAYPKKPE